MSNGTAYLNKEGAVVGYQFAIGDWKYHTGEFVGTKVEYGEERPLPVATLIYDKEAGHVREATHEEQMLILKIEDSKMVRDDATESDLLVFGKPWKMLQIDREHLKDALGETVGAETTQFWITAADEPVQLSQDHIEKILHSYRMRKKKIFDAYIEWAGLGMQGEFSYDEIDSYHEDVRL